MIAAVASLGAPARAQEAAYVGDEAPGARAEHLTPDNIVASGLPWVAIDRSGAHALAAGLDFSGGEDAAARPTLGYRTWIGKKAGFGVQIGFDARSGRVGVRDWTEGAPGGTDAAAASGPGYDVDALFSVFVNARRSDRSTVQIFVAGGPAWRKDLHPTSRTGATALAGLRLDLSPADGSGLGVTLETALRARAYGVHGAPIEFAPVVGIGMQYWVRDSTRHSAGSRHVADADY